jgi:toxin ParE1/3/4
MDYQVVLSLSARADLRDIVRYISFDAPDRALRFGLFLISRTRLLAQSPELGRIVPEFEDPFIREIVVRSYRVVYRLDDSRLLVEVIRFWHAARGIPEINSA